jgi:hypothetical protein
MNLTCNNGKMPWPCQMAWGIALIACVAVIAMIMICAQDDDKVATAVPPPPTKETSHAQP